MWFVLALLSGLLFAINRLIVRSVLAKKVNPMAFGAIHEFLAGALLLPIAFFYFSLPQSAPIWIALLLGIFFIFLCDLFAFLALEKIEASLYQIIGQLRHVVVLFGAFFLFTEAISPIKIASIFLIIFGVYITLLAKSKVKINRGAIYAFLSTVFIALGFLFIKMASVDVSPAFSSSLSLLVAGILMYILLLLKGNKPNTLLIIPNRKQLFIAAAIFSAFELSLFTALAIGEASKVTPVTQSSMIFTLIGGYIFLKEKDRLKEKILGCILIAIGIGFLYFIG